VIEPELFDEKEIIEVIDPDNHSIQVLPVQKTNGWRQRRRRRGKPCSTGQQKLSTRSSRQNERAPPSGLRPGRARSSRRPAWGKLIDWEVKEGRLSYEIKDEKKTLEELLDGCYIKSDTPPTGSEHPGAGGFLQKLTL